MEVVQLGRKHLIGFRVVCEGDRYFQEIPQTAAKLRERVKEIEGAVNPEQLIGAFVVGDCTEEQDGYWIGVEVERWDGMTIPPGMVGLEVPAQRYAVIRHRGPNTGIPRTYETLHAWIAAQGYTRNLCAWHLEITAGPNEIDLYDTLN
ncbi:GyrI-like domain-containing protein [Paenibacillus sp. HJGM_3]|uniref:GyrI-like domain-containing protein n=1 Tax=Paenibacillus sp. HJGM_3 TaxID=3379816 RepID=UPI00385B50E4